MSRVMDLPPDSLALKGPILVYGLFVLGMASISRLVNGTRRSCRASPGRGGRTWSRTEKGALPSLDLGAGPTWRQLAPFMLAGLPLPQGVGADGGAGEQWLRPSDRAARAPLPRRRGGPGGPSS